MENSFGGKYDKSLPAEGIDVSVFKEEILIKCQLLIVEMPQGERTQQALRNAENGIEKLSQDPLKRLANLMVDAIEEGIKEFRRSQMVSEQMEKKISPEKEGGSKERIKNFKRKWNQGNSKDKEDQLKKNKVEACKSCRKTHAGKCLQGKGVCYLCEQEGHIAPQCHKRKKDGCFRCGAQGHLKKNCPKKDGCFECGEQGHLKKDCPKQKKAIGGSSDPAQRSAADNVEEG